MRQLDLMVNAARIKHKLPSLLFDGEPRTKESNSCFMRIHYQLTRFKKKNALE